MSNVLTEFTKKAWWCAPERSNDLTDNLFSCQKRWTHDTTEMHTLRLHSFAYIYTRWIIRTYMCGECRPHKRKRQECGANGLQSSRSVHHLYDVSYVLRFVSLSLGKFNWMPCGCIFSLWLRMIVCINASRLFFHLFVRHLSLVPVVCESYLKCFFKRLHREHTHTRKKQSAAAMHTTRQRRRATAIQIIENHGHRQMLAIIIIFIFFCSFVRSFLKYSS